MREYRYSISHKMHLIDKEPLGLIEPPLVWDPDGKIWTNEGITVAEYLDAVPITDDEAQRFIETGELTQETLHRLECDYPDPWEDSSDWDD